MSKRKQNSLEYDDDFLPPLPTEYGDVPQNTSLKRKKQGCVFALIGAVLLLVFGFVGFRAYQRNLALRPTPTPTYPPDDGVPVQVDDGLAFSKYAANGQRMGAYDISGQTTDIPADIQASLPVSVSGDSLEGLNAIAYPEGAFYDSESGRLVVFGPPSQVDVPTSRDDFLTALQTIYAGDDPGVSIDPNGSQTVQDVRYIGQTANTHFGWVMFEADRRMKTLSMGADNITSASVTSSVPGFANIFDLELQLGDQNQNEVRRRFWFKVPTAEIDQTPDGQGMLITGLTLSVDTEYLDANWETSPTQPPDPAGQAFTTHLTDHLDEYARDFPVFNDLKAVARWTLLAHWLKQADLPIQPELWLTNSPAAYSDAPVTTPAITVSRQTEQGNFIQTLMLWGGVDLGMSPHISEAGEATLGRMQDMTNQFKAWTGVGSMEVAGQGITYGPVSTTQLEQGITSQVELPLSLAPVLEYKPDGWKLRLPRLKQKGTTQGDGFVFEDPTSGEPLVLSPSGQDSETGVTVYVNEERGLWLKQYADGNQLLFGEYDENGKFSYLENDYVFFDLQGNIMQDARNGTEYLYQDGVLTNIQRNGQDLKVSIGSDGRVERMSSTDGDVNFRYKGRELTGLYDANNVAIREFGYDDVGRLESESGRDGEIERLVRYDEEGRVFYKMENNKPEMYDWGEDGTLTVVSGQALVPWQNAGVKELEDLKVMLRLRRAGVIEHMLITRQVGDKLVVMVNDKSYTVPASMLQNPSALRRKLAGVMDVSETGPMILISSGDVQGVSFQSLFPNAIPLLAENMDEVRIRRNVELLRTPQGFDAITAGAINGVPRPEEAEVAGSRSGLWYVEADNEGSPTWKTSFDELFTQPGLGIPSQSATSEQVRKVLSEKQSVLIVVAHSDGQDIYLPDGTKFNPESLSQEERALIAANKPLVVLLSCETAVREQGETSFAQRLLETGPRVVIAPNGTIKVSDAHAILQSFFENPKVGSNALLAFYEALKSIHRELIIPKEEKEPDHYFEFHVQIFNPDPRESYT